MVSRKMPSDIAMIFSGSIGNIGKMLSAIKDFAKVLIANQLNLNQGEKYESTGNRIRRA